MKTQKVLIFENQNGIYDYTGRSYPIVLESYQEPKKKTIDWMAIGFWLSWLLACLCIASMGYLSALPQG